MASQRRYSSQTRDVSNGSQIDHLALKRAQHLESRDHRRKSISDEEPEDPISDWSESDRECSPLSDVEWTSNDFPTQISHFDMTRPLVTISATPVPIVNDRCNKYTNIV